jgi:hypothetical protein
MRKQSTRLRDSPCEGIGRPVDFRPQRRRGPGDGGRPNVGWPQVCGAAADKETPVREVTLENRYFDVRPKIVPADRTTTIEIRPLFDHCRLDDGGVYELRYFPAEEFARRIGWAPGGVRTVRPVGGVLRIDQYFEAEQEHILLVERVEETRRQQVGDFRVYSVGPDLFSRRPAKGDLHIHSHRSDGRESPAYVAAACRRVGLDFMAVTDHRQYGPSLEAQQAYEGVALDLRVFAGEEVHPPESPVHIVNFGGRFSVNDLFGDKEAYRGEVDKVAAKAGALPEGVDMYQYASAVWCFEKIRQGGGLAIFCHPYWFTDHRYSPGGALTSHLLATRPFDALEVIGGFSWAEFDSNTLQVARYHQERQEGRCLPIVGSSDSHGCHNKAKGLFGWYYTIVLSPSPDLPDLVRSVRDLYAVAVEDVPGDRPRPVGPLRLVKYVLFLLREVLPQHDELCVEEGRLMLAHVVGDDTAAESLLRLKGRTGALLERYWAAV